MRNAVVLIVLLLAAWPAGAQEEKPFGRPADPARADRTVRIEMSDQMRFSPALVEAKRGEILRFVVVNRGAVMHEMVLGTMDDLKQHAELMKMPPPSGHHQGDPHESGHHHPGADANHESGRHAGEHVHAAPGMVHLAPGKSSQLGWQFTQAGEFYYGCLIPGHFDAGMIGKVVVTP
jgi:uncharacterized cupredoxin-like copper-binding protein